LLIDLALTHATLAAMVGVGRPFLTMTLSRLEQSGHLRSENRRIIVRDTAGLESLAFETAKRTRQKAGARAAAGHDHRRSSHL
jgi:hypothetical protein